MTGRCTPEIGLGISGLNPEFWPTENIGRYFQEAFKDHENDCFNYLMSPGYLSLCEQISRIGLSSGLNLSPDDISFTDRPDTCKTYDQEGNVILCSSFSKTLSPGLRVGWIVPGKYYSHVLKMKTLLNISKASMNQIAVAKFLNEGGYERHLRNLRRKIKGQVFAMRASILKHFPKGTQVTNPEGGFLLWITLPGKIDTSMIYQEAIKENILIAPGRLFSVKDQYSNCMRLNAGIWNEDIEKAVRHLGKLCSMV